MIEQDREGFPVAFTFGPLIISMPADAAGAGKRSRASGKKRENGFKSWFGADCDDPHRIGLERNRAQASRLVAAGVDGNPVLAEFDLRHMLCP